MLLLKLSVTCLLHEGTKPLPEPILANHPWSLVTSPEYNVTVDDEDMYAWDEFENY